jgi:hypothetical protein
MYIEFSVSFQMAMLNRKQRNTGIPYYEQITETKTLKWLGKM